MSAQLFKESIVEKVNLTLIKVMSKRSDANLVKFNVLKIGVSVFRETELYPALFSREVYLVSNDLLSTWAIKFESL